MITRSGDQAAQPRPQEAVPPVTSPVTSPRPHPWEMVQHPFKTLRFVNGLRKDPRISLIRKLLYLAPLVVLVLALLLPEGIFAVVVATIVPLVGPAINLPTDAVLDWAFLGIAAYAMLGIFPRAIVAEHHAQEFHPRRLARQRLSRSALSAQSATK
ncbi:MAG: hypothetical protein ACLQUY_14230 [Ktedonobacterales bacterium]